MMSFLQTGNVAFSQKRYEDAIGFYVKAVEENPAIWELVEFNLKAAKKRLALSGAVGFRKKRERDLEMIDFMRLRILFLLPVSGGNGGAHSVVQEVTEMRRLGVHACVAMKHEQVAGFITSYPGIPHPENVFLGFDDSSLIELAQAFDVVVGTVYHSMELVRRVVDRFPQILPAYYIQDYEPLFFDEGSFKWDLARRSYTLVPDTLRFAKTHWIINEIKREHGVTVHKVQPSIDHAVYKPAQRQNDGRLRIAAMIRPQTPRRGAQRTMRLLGRLQARYGDQLAIDVFGCESDNRAFLHLNRDFSFVNHGILLRAQVSALLAESDLFLDLSDYQAFGRTALEAMACGCAAVVPMAGGADEYAVHGQNALVVDSLDEEACFRAVSSLLAKPEDVLSLRRAGLATAARYSVHAAAVSECLLIERALRDWRKQASASSKNALLLLPSLSGNGKTVNGSGYVRVLLPYRSPLLVEHWDVQQIDTLPEPGWAGTVLIQRDAPSYSLVEIEGWLQAWKMTGGRLVYEIDDDLLDTDALKLRRYPGDAEVVAAKVRLLASAADLVFVSTESLAQRMRRFNANVQVIPNALDAELWQLNRQRQHADGLNRGTRESPIRIGYIGTPTHDADLDLITDAMRVIEDRFGAAVEIEVIGGFQNRKPTFGQSVRLPKNNDYPSFVRWLFARVHWDIGVIPLTDDRFNEAKSYLKFIECAALEMALVVSDVPSYRAVARHNDNCLLAQATTEDWVEKLSQLINDQRLRQRLALQAKTDCAARHTLEKTTPHIARHLNQLGFDAGASLTARG